MINMKNYYIRVKTEEQLKAIYSWGKAEAVIIDYKLLDTDGYEHYLKNPSGCKVIIALPDVLRESKKDSLEAIYEKCCDADGIMLKSLDGLGMAVEKHYQGQVIGDAFLYAYNKEAIDFYLEMFPGMKFVCSDELTDKEMYDTVKGIKNSFIYKIYGCQQLMVTNQCLSRNYTSCKEKLVKFKDERGNLFAAESNCGQCSSIIYNAQAGSMLDKLDEIDFENLLLDFTVENLRETRAVLEIISGQDLQKKIPDTNRGHHYKGVD